MQAFEPRPEATVFRSVTYIPHTRKQGTRRGGCNAEKMLFP